jgi:hypothetical protein
MSTGVPSLHCAMAIEPVLMSQKSGEKLLADFQ